MTALVIESAVRALLFALAVGAGLWLFRVSNVPVRKAAWTLVLIASVSMPFLMRAPAVADWNARWGWTLPIQLPPAAATALPAKHAAAHPARVEWVAQAMAAPESPRVAAPSSKIPVIPANALDPSSTPFHAGDVGFHWPPAARLIVQIYLAIAGVFFLRLLWGLARAVRLWATAEPVSPLVAPEPNVRSSAKIPSPVTVGSGIVLPASYRQWDSKKLRMVLAHERSHVRQMDFYLQLLAGLYTAAFWFSPLGWWLRRTLASLGEAIGDRAGMEAAASGPRYAEVLLEFAAMPHRTLPGVAMARPGNLSHRVERLLQEPLFRSAFSEGRRRAIVSLLILPAALFAATALIRVPGAAAQTAPQPPPAPVAVPAPAPALAPQAPPASVVLPAMPAPPAETVQEASAADAAQAPAPPPMPGTPAPAIAPVAPTPAFPALPAAAPVPPAPNGFQVEDAPGSLVSNDDQEVNASSYHVSSHGDSYAIVDGPGNDVTFSGNWNGDRKAEIEAARKVAKGPFLWFTHQGKSYIVTDPATIAKIRAMYRPMEDFGRQQDALGRQQDALGRQMDELARQQEAAGRVKMPDLSKEMADLDAAMARFKADQESLSSHSLAQAEAALKAAQDQMLTPEKMAELQSQIAAAQSQWNSGKMAAMEEKLGALQARLGELQGEAGARQGDFGAKMGALGAEQGRLGAEQGRLGAQQGRLGQQIDRQVRSIIDQCLGSGKATPVPPGK
ncbi:MAG: M56 family metallopeptidase [Acidobacteriota bacterium]